MLVLGLSSVLKPSPLSGILMVMTIPSNQKSCKIKIYFWPVRLDHGDPLWYNSIISKISADCYETSFHPCGCPVRVLLKLTGFALFYGLRAFMCL